MCDELKPIKMIFLRKPICDIVFCAIMSHPVRVGRHIVLPPTSICQSAVHPSDCPSQMMSNLMNATPSYNFSPIFLKLCRCFGQCLKMCMRLCCKHQINFCHFELSHLSSQLLSKHIGTGYLVNATPSTILQGSF